MFVIFENGGKKIVATQNQIFLPDRKRILEIMKQAGFKSKLHYDFSDTKRSGTVCVLLVSGNVKLLFPKRRFFATLAPTSPQRKVPE